MIFNSHIIRYYRNNSEENIIKKFLENKNFPLIYYYQDQATIFFITILGNNILVFQTYNNNEDYKVLSLPVNHSLPQNTYTSNYYANFDNQSSINYFSELKLFNIHITNLYNYTPNIEFQNTLYNILCVYETRKNVNIITNSSFFGNNIKTDFLNELQNAYQNNLIPSNEVNIITSQSPFLNIQIPKMYDLVIENLSIPYLSQPYRINTYVISGESQQDQTTYNIIYYKDICKSILGAYNSYQEYSNINLNYYRVYLNADIIRYIFNSNQTGGNKTLFSKTFIINDSITSDDITISAPDATFSILNNQISSQIPGVNKIFIYINEIVDKYRWLINLSQTNTTINKNISTDYLSFVGMKNIYENIPGLNEISSIIKNVPSNSSFNHINLKDPDVTNLSYIEIPELKLIIIPKLTIRDIDTNTSRVYYFMFLNDTTTIYLPQSLDAFDQITIENYFNLDKVNINRPTDEKTFFITNLLKFTIKYFDNTNIYPDYTSIYGNILYYLQSIKSDIYSSELNSFYTLFKIRLNIKLNKKLLDYIDTTTYGDFKIYGVGINKNINLNNTISLINNINYSNTQNIWLNNLQNLKSLKNQNNIYPFPLPIIIIRNNITFIPALSLSSINIINQYFDQTTFHNDLFSSGIDILETAENIINILTTYSPDNTDDINILKSYITLSYNSIKSGLNSNDIAFIFNLVHVSSQEVFPFLVQNGRQSIFIANASLSLNQTNTTLTTPESGINAVSINNAEKNMFIDYSNYDTFLIDVDPGNIFTYKVTFKSMPIIIPIDYIEILNIKNIFSNVTRIELTLYKVVDFTNKTTIPYTIDITDVESIYNPDTNKHYIYLYDNTDVFVDYAKVKLYVEIPRYTFEFTDIIRINFISKFNELNRSSDYRIRVRYVLAQSQTYTLSNIIPLTEYSSLISNNYYMIQLSKTIYNISDNKLQSYLNSACLFLSPVNINIHSDSTFLIPDQTKVISDLTNYDPTLSINNIHLLNLLSPNINYNKVNNILYLNPLYSNQNKYVRGFIKVTSSSPNLIINLISMYDNTSHSGYKIFLDGKVSNLFNPEDLNDYLKFHRIILDTTVKEFTLRTLVPVTFDIRYKFYNNKSDFVNDISSTIVEYSQMQVFEVLSLSDYITHENSYTPNILPIIKKEEVYPEFGTPKDYIFNLQIKVKTRDTTIANISKVFFDIVKFTSDVEFGIYNHNEFNNYSIGDNIANLINNTNFRQESDTESILKHFNKYLLLKASSFPNATEIVLNGVVRVRPRFYGINFAGISLNSFTSNLKIQQILPYLYITEYGNVLSIFKNNGIIHTDDLITNEFKNLLPDQAKELDFYAILSKFRQPISSYSSIQLLNCTNRNKNLEFNIISNTSGKIYKGQNKIFMSIGPYEFKNIKITEGISINDYTNSNSGMIKFDLTNISDQYSIDRIHLPIPSLDKYIYQMISFIDNLNVNRDTEEIKVITNRVDKDRDFDNNIMINKIDNSLLNQTIYFDATYIPILKSKIDLLYVTSIGEADQNRCVDSITNFVNIINSGYVSIPIDVETLMNNTSIEYKFLDGKNVSFKIGALKTYIVNDLMTKYGISKTNADITATDIILNDYLNIFIPGNTVGTTTYLKMTYYRSNIFEWKYSLNTDIFINVTNILNPYVISFIKYLLKISYNIQSYDINEVKLSTRIPTFKPEEIIKNMFIGFNLKSTGVIYNTLVNKTPNITYKDLKSTIIENSGVIFNLEFIVDNSYIYSKMLKYPMINNIYCNILNNVIYYSLESPKLDPDPDILLGYYLEQKDILERNNYPCNYIIDFSYKNVLNTSPENLVFNPIVNNIIYYKPDNMAIIDVNINDLKLLNDGIKFYRNNVILSNNILKINSLYPKFETIRLNINNFSLGPYYNTVYPRFLAGKDVAKSKSKFYSRLSKEYNSKEFFEYSLFSKLPPRIVVSKIINPNTDIICAIDIVLEKYIESLMSLDTIEIFSNMPNDITCYLITKDNELFRIDDNRIIRINKEFSRYLTGVERVGTVYITGRLTQTGEYQLLLNIKYSLLANTYSNMNELLVRIYKPEALDNEYIILKHERLDSPIDISKIDFKDMSKSLELLNNFKKYAFSHVRGLCGGGGFHYRDKFQDLE